MGIKNNAFILGRAVYFTPASISNDYSGLSVENAVIDLSTSVDIVNALSPIPEISNPASINAWQTGASFSGVTIPDSTFTNCRLFAVITADAVAIQLGSDQDSEFGAIVGTGNNTINTLIDGESRVTSSDSTMTVGSDGVTAVRETATVFAQTTGNIGVKTTGICEDIFVSRRAVSLRGEGAIGIEYTAEMETPAVYMLDSSTFFNKDQTLVKAVTATDQQIEVTLITARISDTAAVPNAGSKLFDISGTVVTATGQTIEAETLATVSDEGTLILSANGALGDLILDTIGDALLNLGFLVGDITVGVGSTLTIICPIHFGTITNNGTINGIINGVRFGNWKIGLKTVTVTSTPFTITDEELLFVDPSVAATDIVINLPLSADRFDSNVNSAIPVTVKNINTNNAFKVNVFASGGDSVEENTDVLLFKGVSLTFAPDGITDWRII